MKQSEFLEQLAAALRQNGVADIADIEEEYAQHFAFRLADGFSEEEIAAKLGDPAQLAAQFGAAPARPAQKGSLPATVAGLCLADLGAGAFFVLLAAWGVALVAAALGSLAVAVCLLCNTGLAAPVVPMPYGSAALFGAALAALAVLAAVGSAYFFAFLRQLARAYGRFHRNAMAAARGRAVLPAVPPYPRFAPKAKRRMRLVALIALCAFAALAVLACAVSMLQANAVEFWHTWGWFGYRA